MTFIIEYIISHMKNQILKSLTRSIGFKKYKLMRKLSWGTFGYTL